MYILIVTIVIGILLIVGYFLIKIKWKKESENKEELNVSLNKLSFWLLYIATLSLISVLFSTFFLTREAEWDWADFSSYGDLGDAIGGLTSPFIRISGVIVTGLAFYMQYQANKLQVKIFKQ